MVWQKATVERFDIFNRFFFFSTNSIYSSCKHREYGAFSSLSSSEMASGETVKGTV